MARQPGRQACKVIKPVRPKGRAGKQAVRQQKARHTSRQANRMADKEAEKDRLGSCQD
jgi:hypothetical protein